MRTNSDLSVIQQCFDLLLWLIPRLEKLPRSHKYTLGDRIQNSGYELLELMVLARYSSEQVTKRR